MVNPNLVSFLYSNFCFLILSFSIIPGYSQPIVTLSTNSSSPTNDNPITVFVDFSEKVTGLAWFDFDITNGQIDRQTRAFNFGSEGYNDGEFDRPQGVAIGKSGKIYISDFYRNVVQVFSENGEFIFAFGKQGGSPGKLDRPWALALDPEENIYIASSNSRVEKFDKNGNYLLSFHSNSQSGQFYLPTGIALDKDSNVYILHRINGPGLIEIFDNSGTFLRKIPLEANRPLGIAVDDDMNIYAVVNNGENVYILNKEGAQVATINDFNMSGIYLNSHGNIFTTHRNKIKKRGINGNVLQVFGSGGIDIGSVLNMHGITGDGHGRIIAIDAHSKIFVIDEPDFYDKIEIVPVVDGVVSIQLPIASVTSSSNGLGNTPSNQLTIDYDGTRPQWSFETELFTNTSPINTLFSFDENIYDFTTEDILVEGGNKLNFESIDLMNYSLEIELVAETDVLVSIDENKFFDEAGNGNVRSDTLNIRYDTTPPSLQLSTSNSNPNFIHNTKPIGIKLTFNEPIDESTLSINKFQTNGGSINHLIGSQTSYTAEVTPQIPEGTITISVNEAEVTDLAGNSLSESNILEILYDPTPIEVTIEGEDGNFTSNGASLLSITFSEPISGFTEKDLTITNGQVVAFQGSDKIYEIGIRSNLNESWMDVYLAKDAGLNQYGFGNPSTEYFVYVDTTRTTLDLTSPISSPTLENIIPVNIEIDDEVFDFEADPIFCFLFGHECFTEDDIEIKGGTIVDFKRESSGYSMNILAKNKRIRVHVPENAFINLTNLGNLPSNHLEFEYFNGIVSIEEETLGKESINHWIDAERNLNIKINNEKVGGQLRLINYAGKTIIMKNINQNHWKTSLDHIANGVYLIIMETDRKIQKSKILIQNR